MSKNRDAYVIHANNPCRPSDCLAFTADSDVTFRLQKYCYSKSDKEYQAFFRHEIPINLHIGRISKDSPVNHKLPVLLDAHPRLPLPKAIALYSHTDPILRRLSPELRLVFRYDPARDVGVLVHFGYDFDALDAAPLLYLWLSVDNIERDDNTQPTTPSNP